MINRAADRRWRLVVSLVVAAIGGLSPTGPRASGQETTANDADAPTLSETSIYIPYEELQEVFEREGRGVFLPYEEFQALWAAARRGGARLPVDPRPPVDALITETENRALVGPDIVQVQSQVRIELLRSGWTRIPLGLRDAAITAATIDGAPAQIVYHGDRGYELLYRNVPEGGGVVELSLAYAKSITRTPGRNSVSFRAPQAPISRWTVTIPEAGVKVDLDPLIAATELPTDEEAPDQTRVLAFVGAAEAVGIHWNPRAEGATGLDALASARCEQQVHVAEGIVRIRAEISFTISRAELATLRLLAPDGYRVINVFDANVRQWSVQTTSAGQRSEQLIEIDLFEPARTVQRVQVELERFIQDQSQGPLQVPVLVARDVARQQGVLAVDIDAELQAEVDAIRGLVQVDAGELPESLRGQAWEFAYRYASVPVELSLQVSRVEPTMTAASLVLVQLRPERLELDHLVQFDVQRAGVFELELNVPEVYEIRRVRGQSFNGQPAAEVERFARDPDDPEKVVVRLARKAMGPVGLAVRLTERLSHPELIAPTGTAAAIDLPVPTAVGERRRGGIIVFAPEQLRVTPARTEGVRTTSVQEAGEVIGVTSFPGVDADAQRAVLAYVYGEDPVLLAVAAERRQPFVAVRQLLTARIEPGVVKYDAAFFYDIRYSGVRTLRIDVPSDLTGSIRNRSSGVREEVIDPQPDDVTAGNTAWRFTGEQELLGAARLDLTWEMPLANLDVGTSVDIAVPRLVPMRVDRGWGQVVLTKSESLDVQAAGEPAGLRPIDPQHDLMSGASIPDAARAFEFQGPWSLVVTATHYQLQEIKRSSIERALVRVVVTRSDRLSVQALYRMRSARQRLRVTLPANRTFDTQPLRINGRAVALERGNQDDFFLPLVGMTPETPFLLELRYTMPGGPGRLELPTFPDEPAVQKVYLSAYLPPEIAVLGSRGPWTDEMVWRYRRPFRWIAQPRRSESSLIEWVGEGVSLSGDSIGGFPTDGVRFLYSTLQPTAPPEGALSLVTLGRRLLSLLIVGIVVVGGLLLLRAPAWSRAVGAATFVTGLILCGVFAPTFTLRVMDRVLLSAVGIVLVVWAVWYFLITRPRDPALQARRAARQEAKLAMAAAASAPPPLPSSPLPPPTKGSDDDAS